MAPIPSVREEEEGPASLPQFQSSSQGGSQDLSSWPVAAIKHRKLGCFTFKIKEKKSKRGGYEKIRRANSFWRKSSLKSLQAKKQVFPVCQSSRVQIEPFLRLKSRAVRMSNKTNIVKTVTEQNCQYLLNLNRYLLK